MTRRQPFTARPLPSLLLAIALILTASFTPNIVKARDFSDPTWPCIQRKVPRLSIGVLWPIPPVEAQLTPSASVLAETLTLRRISLAEAQVMIDRFVRENPQTPPEIYGAVFNRIFDNLDRLRTELISGIGEFSLSQIALSEKIQSSRVEMQQLEAADSPDFDKIDQIEETLEWSERIFKDRQSVVTYVCESPVLLEQRLYAIAQILAPHAQ